MTKLNPTGSASVYSTYLGGSGSDEAPGIAVDSSGTPTSPAQPPQLIFLSLAGPFRQSAEVVSASLDLWERLRHQTESHGIGLGVLHLFGG